MQLCITGKTTTIIFSIFRKTHGTNECVEVSKDAQEFTRTLSIPKLRIPFAVVVKYNLPKNEVTVSGAFMGFEVYSDVIDIKGKNLGEPITLIKRWEPIKGIIFENFVLTLKES